MNNEPTNIVDADHSSDSVQSDIDSCQGTEDCIVAAEDCDEIPNAQDCDEQSNEGEISQEYVVKGCKVTVYRDGPIRMVHEKTNQPCNAPIPKNHDFGADKHVYEKDGCIITEYVNRQTGPREGPAPDCSK